MITSMLVGELWVDPGSHCGAEMGSLRHVSLPDSDEALMAAYVEGDSQAFGQLFTRYAPLLLRLGRRHLGNEEAARELAQQTFLRLHAARRDFTPGQRLHPWLMTIAMNLVRDQWRSRRRKPITSLEFDPPADPGEPSMPERLAEMRELHRALGELPQAQREVVELHWFQERPYSEVAQIMGASEGAVRVRAHRAYAQLKKLLQESKLHAPGKVPTKS